MNEKSILVIGAGIAGLSAGVYARMNGFRCTIFELHSQPGGLCTSWKRQGYTFDGCIHWLVGTNPHSRFHRIWEELGALQDKQIVNHDEFLRVVDPSGKTFILYNQPDRLEASMRELSPQDAGAIHEFADAIRTASHIDMPASSPQSLGEMLSMLTALPSLLRMVSLTRRYGKMSLQQFTERFQDPFLRHALVSVFGLDDFPMLGVLLSLGWMAAKDAGFPIGGSLAFARNIEQRYLALGGEIRYQSRVERILVEGGRAVGVRLTNGEEVRGDYVISAGDGHATHFDLLGGQFLTDEIRADFTNRPIFAPLVMVSLGVNLDLRDQPAMVTYLLDQPLSIAGQERHEFGIKHFSFDPTLSPQGKSVVEVMFGSNHAYWKALAKDPERYDAEKKEIAIRVIEQIEQLIPGLAEKVEVVDVATPLTFERYTANWQGSMEGWQMTMASMQDTIQGKSMSKTVPGLENFYMVGQWVEPGGGLPPAATSARGVIQNICRREGLRFQATTA